MKVFARLQDPRQKFNILNVKAAVGFGGSMTRHPIVMPQSMELYSQRLQAWMATVGLHSYRALSKASGVPRSQINRLRAGQAEALSVRTAGAIAQSLHCSLSTLMAQFSAVSPLEGVPQSQREAPLDPSAADAKLAALRQECLRLQGQLEVERTQAEQAVRQEVLHDLESLLLLWPTAAHAARQNPTAPALKLIPLLRPLEQLLARWGITVIGTVGETTHFDPTQHQWVESHLDAPSPGSSVQVTHVGYRQGEQLLYRAKVRGSGDRP